MINNEPKNKDVPNLSLKSTGMVAAKIDSGGPPKNPKPHSVLKLEKKIKIFEEITI